MQTRLEAKSGKTMIVISLGIGQSFQQAVNAQKRFINVLGTDGNQFIVIDSMADDRTNEGTIEQQMWYQKLCILDTIKGNANDWVIYHDADFHLVKKMPVFDLLDGPDYNLFAVKDRTDKAVILEPCAAMSINPDLYFNAGFYICKYQLLKQILKEAKKIFDPSVMRWGDQDAMNKAVQVGKVASKVNICYLPQNHNYLDFQVTDDPQAYYGIHNSHSHKLNNI